MADERTLLSDATAALTRADRLDQVQQTVRETARRLVDAQGATVVLLEDDHCYYADEDAISPLWKGQRFPLRQCISGWAMLNGAPAVVPDISLDARIPQQAYRPTFVRSLVVVPIRPHAPLGAIGAYWRRPYRASDGEIRSLQALADAASGALQRLLAG